MTHGPHLLSTTVLFQKRRPLASSMAIVYMHLTRWCCGRRNSATLPMWPSPLLTSSFLLDGLSGGRTRRWCYYFHTAMKGRDQSIQVLAWNAISNSLLEITGGWLTVLQLLSTFTCCADRHSTCCAIHVRWY